DLAAFYPYPKNSYPVFGVIGAALLLLSISAAVWRLRRFRYLAFGWLWFLGTLVPVIGLVQVGDQAMADRYQYIPILGAFVMVAYGGKELGEKLRITPRLTGI